MSRAVAAGGALVFKGKDFSLLIFRARAVEMLLEDWLGFDGLELGLKVFGAFGVGGRVGAATRVGHVDVSNVGDFISWMAPVAFSAAVLLGLLWVNIDMTMLAKVFGEHGFSRLVLFSVNAVTEFVGASHDGIEDWIVDRENVGGMLRLL